MMIYDMSRQYHAERIMIPAFLAVFVVVTAAGWLWKPPRGGVTSRPRP